MSRAMVSVTLGACITLQEEESERNSSKAICFRVLMDAMMNVDVVEIDTLTWRLYNITGVKGWGEYKTKGRRRATYICGDGRNDE